MIAFLLTVAVVAAVVTAVNTVMERTSTSGRAHEMAESATRAARDLFLIRRRLDVARTRSEIRREADRLRRELHEELTNLDDRRHP